jgi:hypothetical protein
VSDKNIKEFKYESGAVKQKVSVWPITLLGIMRRDKVGKPDHQGLSTITKEGMSQEIVIAKEEDKYL